MDARRLDGVQGEAHDVADAAGSIVLSLQMGAKAADGREAVAEGLHPCLCLLRSARHILNADDGPVVVVRFGLANGFEFVSGSRSVPVGCSRWHVVPRRDWRERRIRVCAQTQSGCS